MAQLDGLRAFAVLAVVFYHYVAGHLAGYAAYPLAGYAAYSGVRLFFALSGFLITGILLRARDDAELEGVKRIGALARFYARRSLRIFPLYYVVVGLVYVVDFEPARALIGWLLTYTLNLFMAHQGWLENRFAHFWSLAVEEQFYLFWPWVILFLRRRWLIPATLAMVSLAPLWRLSYALSGYTTMTSLATGISTVSCLDHLGLGALLALIVHRHPERAGDLRRLTVLLLPLAVAGATAARLLPSLPVFLALHDPLQAVAFCCVIHGASRGYGGLAGRVLSWTPILYVGKISYGVYVYHPFMPPLVAFILLRATGVALAEEELVISAGAAALTVAVAALSWHAMERPINALKRYV